MPSRHPPHQILANYKREKCDFTGEKLSRHHGDQGIVTGRRCVTCLLTGHTEEGMRHSKCTPSGESWENSPQSHVDGRVSKCPAGTCPDDPGREGQRRVRDPLRSEAAEETPQASPVGCPESQKGQQRDPRWDRS